MSVPEGDAGALGGRKELVVARAGLYGYGQGHAPLKSLTARALPVHLLPSFSNNCYLCHLKIRI